MATVTVKQLARRIETLGQSVERLADQRDHQQAVDGVRRGLESASGREGITGKAAVARLKRLRKARGAG